jgi:hypothetical protein
VGLILVHNGLNQHHGHLHHVWRDPIRWWQTVAYIRTIFILVQEDQTPYVQYRWTPETHYYIYTILYIFPTITSCPRPPSSLVVQCLTCESQEEVTEVDCIGFKCDIHGTKCCWARGVVLLIAIYCNLQGEREDDVHGFSHVTSVEESGVLLLQYKLYEVRDNK